VALWVKENFKKELVKLQSYKSKCYKEALEEIFLKLDELMESPAGQRRLMELQSQSEGGFGDSGKSFAGCTSTVILVTRTEVICANAGDSRTVLARGGRAKDMSEDHKPDNPGELSRIQRSGGFVEEGRVNGMLALSRALGDFEYKNNSSLPARDQAVSAFPDVRIEPLDPQTQFVLLACDGIWDVKSSQEAVDFLMTKLYRGNFSQRRTL
jgi:serine/threonine protein phosphatase PrpC